MNQGLLIERLRGWLPLLPVLALLLGSYWLNLQVQPLQPATGAQRHDVDFVVQGLRSTALDQSGQPRFTLQTDKMWHFPDDDTTYLENPHLTSFLREQAPTKIQARSGMLSSQGEDVFLREDVSVLRPGVTPASDKHFHTEYLHAIPDRDWAETDFPVLMFDRYNTINAIGMEMDNQARTVKLLKQVRAQHEKND